MNRRRFLGSAVAGGLLANARPGFTGPMVRAVEPVGMLIRECGLPGERRADDVVPAHPNGIQVSRDRWVMVFATRGFRGVDDDLSIVYQLRENGPEGKVLREGHLARTQNDWDPLGNGEKMIKQHGHPVAFGVPKGARIQGMVPAHANLFVAKWRQVARLLDPEKNKVLPRAEEKGLRQQTQKVEWVQFRLNDREDDIEIVQPVSQLRQRGFERGQQYCSNENAGAMNQTFTPPVPFNANRSEWADVNHFDQSRLAALKYVYNAKTQRYEWTEIGPMISADKRSLTEASLARAGSDWVIAARASGLAWLRCQDPFGKLPPMTFAREPSMGAPLTVFTCADGVLRLFGGSAAVSPHRNARDPLYCWDIDPAKDFSASNRQTLFDSVQAGLKIRPRAVPKVDMCKLLPPQGRSQLVVFRVSVRSYNHPYVGGATGAATDIPPIVDEEKQACGIYAARLVYNDDVPPMWVF